MKEVSTHVGNRIRLYRKMKNLTIESFALMIGKSKATISKYETGDISIDVETLFKISEALGLSMTQLVDYEKEDLLEETHITGKTLNGKTRFYLYFYDGRKSRIVKNVIDVIGEGENGLHKASFYSDVADYKNIYKCKFLYQGKMRKYDGFTNFTFENQNNKIEKVFMYAINPFTHSGNMIGMLSGLSTQPILPVSFKVIISTHIMEDEGMLREQLVLTKDELKQVKKMNMFVVDHHN